MKYIPILLLLCYSLGNSQTISDSMAAVKDAAHENPATHTMLDMEQNQDQDTVFLLENAALSAYKLGDLPKAKAFFLKLEKIDSTHKKALTTLANIYEFENNTPRAIKYYHLLIKDYPENAINFRKLAQQYQKAGLQKDALNYYTQALKLNPKDHFTIKGLAELYLRAKQFTKSDSLLKLGLESDSLNISFNLLMANSKYLQKAYDSTVYYMEVIKSKYDLRPHQNKMLGYAYMQVDSIDKAIYHLTQAINDKGTKEYAHFNLGVAYEKKGESVYALHHYEEAVKAAVSQDLDLYHRNAARLYSKNEDLKSAIPHYQDALKYGEDPVLLFYLARAADAYYKDKSIAIRYYARFINSNYDHPEYQAYSRKQKRYLQESLHQQIKGN